MRLRMPEHESSIHLDFVPMVDTLFNLVVFFLLATSIAQVEREMGIALPSASAALPISVAMRELTINIDADGGIHVNGHTVEAARLREMIVESVKVNPEQKVMVRGDRRTAYANVVAVLDVCKGGGIQQPYIDTVLEQ